MVKWCVHLVITKSVEGVNCGEVVCSPSDYQVQNQSRLCHVTNPLLHFDFQKHIIFYIYMYIISEAFLVDRSILRICVGWK